MKTLLNAATIAFLTISTVALASPEKDTLIQTEKSVWQTIKDKNFDAFDKFLSSDFRGVYPTGINPKDKEGAEVRTLDFKSYSLGEIDVVFIDKDAALLTYEVTIEGAAAGHDMSGRFNAASVWKKEGSDWRVSFHTDMKAEPVQKESR